ncbi:MULTISPECIES: agmatinase [Roseateles]|uniref:Agmatinase n=1 Tax=Roseateles albus TaxID=2987525 RepID=A0ABT5KH16_9BURK|nr:MULTISPECIES: agmatinase [Roseateles]MCV2358411.1 agmatinase [Paucibacter sp. TC2R-5]MDC8772260.1 agmatinase [Roseateles albus]
MSNFAFLSNNTFMKVAARAAQPFAIAGVAWDGCVTNRPGARFGPRAIRQASHMLCDGTHPLFDTTPEGALTDLGDLLLPNTSLDAMRAAMLPLIAPMIASHHMAWLGGDHSITLPLLRAYKAHYGRPLAVVHFDAHCDTWTDHFGEPSGHGTWVYEAIQEGLVIPECFVQFGIRSAGQREARDYVADQGGLIYTARALRGLESPAALGSILQAVRERMAAHGHPPLYLSLDIDCLDPAFAPGTGTPEPGGMTTNQVFSILEDLVPQLNFVGMDCVEVAPPYDHAELSSYAAAQMVWTYLCARLAAAGSV